MYLYALQKQTNLSIIERMCIYMKYNYVKIGERIREERKAAGHKSQKAFIEYLYDKYHYSMGRNTLSDIETGKTNHYDCDLLYYLCDTFHCEMGYLLCEYDCKTGRNTDIEKETGLNEKSIAILSEMLFENNASGLTDILNMLINHPYFPYMLSLLGNNSTGKLESVSIGRSHIPLYSNAIINSELKDRTIEIANDIRKEYKPNEYALYYQFLYSLYRDGTLTLDQVKETEKEYAKGNYEYVPKGFKRKE